MKKLLSIAVVLLLCGCGINPKLTDSQNAENLKAKLTWVDKAIEIAKKHGVSYRIEIDSTGRPGVGEDLNLYFDTGITARIIFMGNASHNAKGDK